MKTIVKTLFFAVLVSIPVLLTGQEKGKNTETVKFKTSIDCEACVNKIMGNLPREKGIKDVKCDLETKEVTVTYNNEKTSTDMVQRNLEKLGYIAKPVKETESSDKNRK